ncbi:hypothetical protein WA026_020434 [Henosepilachna vigintioctopunctata]|uniref:Uncharacterized protein n=1 Tax=Henosepilachna vigintioctopunctata TaxID=420089 RepID=A0AAW1UQQ4_9CUCU
MAENTSPTSTPSAIIQFINLSKWIVNESATRVGEGWERLPRHLRLEESLSESHFNTNKENLISGSRAKGLSNKGPQGAGTPSVEATSDFINTKKLLRDLLPSLGKRLF